MTVIFTKSAGLSLIKVNQSLPPELPLGHDQVEVGVLEPIFVPSKRFRSL